MYHIVLKLCDAIFHTSLLKTIYQKPNANAHAHSGSFWIKKVQKISLTLGSPNGDIWLQLKKSSKISNYFPSFRDPKIILLLKITSEIHLRSQNSQDYISNRFFEKLFTFPKYLANPIYWPQKFIYSFVAKLPTVKC